MKYFLMLILFPVIAIAYGIEKNTSDFSSLHDIKMIPEPPSISSLPPLESVSDMMKSCHDLPDLKKEFSIQKDPYQGSMKSLPSDDICGVWRRSYTQNTSLFNIPALSEEVLNIESSGKALWVQDVKTMETVQSSSQRFLQVAYYDLFGYPFLVFYYIDQDPLSQKVRDKQGFFVRILTDQSYMQMSTTPMFDPEKSIYWKKDSTSDYSSENKIES